MTTENSTTSNESHIDIVNVTDPGLDSDTRTITIDGSGQNPATPDFSTFVPDDYKEKEYIKNLMQSSNPQAELFKQFDNLQSMIGKRQSEGAVPAADAPQEEWDKYYEKLRPAEATAYELDLSLGEDLKDVDEFMQRHRDDAHLDQIKSLFHKHGLTPKQAAGIAKDYNALEAAQVKNILAQQKEAAERVDQDFNKLVEASFGSSTDSALSAGKKFIEQFVPQHLRQHMASLPNEALMLFAAAGLEYEKRDLREDGRPSTALSGSGQDAKATLSNLVSEWQKLDPMDPKRETLNKQMMELAAQIHA